MSLEQTNKILITIKEDKKESQYLFQNQNKGLKEISQSFIEIDQPITDHDCYQSQENLVRQEDQDLPLNQPYKINALAKLAAVVAALSRYVCKSKVSLENGTFDSQIFYYFYGKKDFFTNGNIGLKISSIFKEFHLLQIEIDQKALLLSIIITYGISIYFAFKVVKNLISAPKKSSKN